MIRVRVEVIKKVQVSLTRHLAFQNGATNSEDSGNDVPRKAVRLQQSQFVKLSIKGDSLKACTIVPSLWDDSVALGSRDEIELTMQAARS